MATASQNKVSRDELVDRARGLIPLLRDKADDAERQRRVAPEAIAAMREADFFRILQPERFGGFEYDFGMIVRIAGELGQGCASTAWVCDLAIMHQWLVANFPIEAQDDVWGDDPGAITFGSYSPVTDAIPEDGGWRISGSWPFASGCDYGQWGLLGVRFPAPDDGGKPETGFVLVPAADYGFDDDWFTNGLKATGSKRIVCKDVFVPGHRRLNLEEVKSGDSPGFRALGRPLYSIPMFSAIPTAICGPALGALQGAIVDFTELVGTRKTIAMGGGHAMADFAAVQSNLAGASAALDAARLMILRDMAETHAVVESGAKLGMDLRLRNRMTHSYVLKLAVEAIDGLYGVTGVTGIYQGSRIERAWRDIHAISHHISLNWDAGSERYGSYLLGREPTGQF